MFAIPNDIFKIDFIFDSVSLLITSFCCFFPYPVVFVGEHPAAMQHNSAVKQFVVHPMLVLPVAIIVVAGEASMATKLMATVTVITAAMSSILFEISIVLARFRKLFTSTMLWPSASVWVVRWNFSASK